MRINQPVVAALFLIFCNACNRGPETGPCLEVPADFRVSLHEPPEMEDRSFFEKNYKACKKRRLNKNPNALFSVGVSVLHGLGTQKDPMKAFLWFKGAADKDHKGAQRILAGMFEEGVGVHKDPLIAQKYIKVLNES